MRAEQATTVGHRLRDAVARHGAREAVVIAGQTLSYRQVLDEAEAYARRLAGLGVQRGDHVGILMPNCLEYLLLFYGCALLGASPVHFNARYKREDLAYVIPDSDVRVLFVSGKQRRFFDFRGMLEDVFPELRDWTGAESLRVGAAPRLERVFLFHAEGRPGWPDERAFEMAATNHREMAAVDPEDIALVMYTSGTTARPKACLLSHRALEFAGSGLAQRFQMTEQDRFWDPLPFFHMSTMLPLAACRAVGAAFIGQEHFEPGPSIREIVDERATILFPSFPTVTTALFGHPDFDPGAFHRVRVVNNVGPPDLLRRNAAMLPTAVHVSAYGLTEAGGVIAFNELSDSPDQLAETAGVPFDGVEVRIVDPDTLDELPTGESGEIQIRGPSVFSGYYNDVEKTAETLLSDGWLRTGDRAALDRGGRIRYLGRMKDMLKVAGENVAAIEIESYLCTHPAIKVAQVVGAPDERLVEVPAAFIELQDGASLSREDVIRYCRGKIASFKIPRYVAFVTSWPMSATKIQKFRLRDRVSPADRIEPGQVS